MYLYPCEYFESISIIPFGNTSLVVVVRKTYQQKHPLSFLPLQSVSTEGAYHRYVNVSSIFCAGDWIGIVRLLRLSRRLFPKAETEIVQVFMSIFTFLVQQNGRTTTTGMKVGTSGDAHNPENSLVKYVFGHRSVELCHPQWASEATSGQETEISWVFLSAVSSRYLYSGWVRLPPGAWKNSENTHNP